MKKQRSNPAAGKRFYSVKEAASYTSLSSRLIYQKLKERAIRSYRIGRKIVLDIQDIDAFIMSNEARTSDELREILKETMNGKRRTSKIGKTAGGC